MVKAEPTSVAGPKYRPKVNFTSGNVGTLSLHITQSYQLNSHMWLMLAVLPVIMVSGTSSLVIYTLLLVDEWINASSSEQNRTEQLKKLGNFIDYYLPYKPGHKQHRGISNTH